MAAPKPVEPLPLGLRIDLAEAFCELTWQRIKALPLPRGFNTAREYNRAKADIMETLDMMLDKLSCMYAERDGITIPDTLEAVS